ncbi:hypothetical protein ASE85_20155 [Sphingobium sp. Leaf26]|uniref:hypothetical protein n=1 Tax=Sphingobium sp. Leaf26 TaxID=1735693 RepID=UPI000702014E|nr:hypothetical protein [Sphingobium sp. Leaf26]KQN05379.1 hypothetical protein ASE85_20155 [Sphingobium sp. Leaf26]
MRRGFLIAAAMFGMGSPMAAQKPTPAPVAPQDATPHGPADPFAQAIAAQQVADFARRERDPHAMLTAARMLQQVPMSGDRMGGDRAQDDAAFSPAALFAEARALARDDQSLLLQIRMAQSAGRGVVASAFGKGLVRRVLDVDPRNAYRFTVTAKGGEPLRIGAIGDIGTNMYIRLLDASGKQICLDDNRDYAPVCAVTPRASGQYRVDIGNRSAARSRTVILSN